MDSAQNTPKKQHFIKSLSLMLIAFTAGMLFLVIIVAGITLVSDALSPSSSITVTGVASKEVKPDQARMTFTIFKESEDANTIIDSQSEEIKKRLVETFELDEDNIVIKKSSYSRNRYYDEPSDLINRVEANFEVVIEDLEEKQSLPNEITTTIVELAEIAYSQVSYEVKDRADICKDLEIEAIRNGYDRSVEQVNALGGRRVVSRNVTVENGCDGYGYGYYPVLSRELATSDAKVEGVPDVSTGSEQIEVRVLISVEYK